MSGNSIFRGEILRAIRNLVIIVSLRDGFLIKGIGRKAVHPPRFSV